MVILWLLIILWFAGKWLSFDYWLFFDLLVSCYSSIAGKSLKRFWLIFLLWRRSLRLYLGFWPNRVSNSDSTQTAPKTSESTAHFYYIGFLLCRYNINFIELIIKLFQPSLKLQLLPEFSPTKVPIFWYIFWPIKNGLGSTVGWARAIKLVGWVWIPFGSIWRLDKRCWRPVQPRARRWWWDAKKRLLPLALCKCGIHCESSRVAHGAKGVDRRAAEHS